METLDVTHKRDRRSIDRFYAPCPICLKTVRLICGADLTRTATNQTPLRGWFGDHCQRYFDVTAREISGAMAATRAAVAEARQAN